MRRRQRQLRPLSEIRNPPRVMMLATMPGQQAMHSFAQPMVMLTLAMLIKPRLDSSHHPPGAVAGMSLSVTGIAAETIAVASTMDVGNPA